MHDIDTILYGSDMIPKGIIVSRCTYTLMPLIPFDSIEWYSLYHYQNNIEFCSDEQNRGLSIEQLYLIHVLNKLIPGCGREYVYYLSYGIKCCACKQLRLPHEFHDLERRQQDHRVCRQCWRMHDHWSIIPFSIKQILNIDVTSILPIYSQHQVHTGHTYIEDIAYLGNKVIMCNNTFIRVFVFKFSLWQSKSVHALIDSLGYIVAVDFDRNWILRDSAVSIYGVQLLPCIGNMKTLLPCVKGYQWILNKIRFGFV